MSTIEMTATQTTARTNTTTAVTRVLWSKGQVIEILVPPTAKLGSTKDGEIDFLHFTFKVKKESPIKWEKGKVNVFVHTGDTSMCGKVITAQVSVMEKTVEGGRRFIHIDLLPVIWRKVTHFLSVVPERQQKTPRDWDVFDTYGPLIGTIILAPIKTAEIVDGKIVAKKVTLPVPMVPKVVPPPTKIATPAVRPAPPAPPAPIQKDLGLERRYKEGWEFDHVDKDGATHLKKIRKGETRRMVHYPKKK